MGDHPRMRGVYPLDGLIVDRPTGSSPHARGLRGALGEDHAGWRIIPACAGFTPRRPHRPEDRSDHPRMRGVYATVMGNFFSESGSSPHARGLPGGPGGLGCGVGIIPACAGFTLGLLPVRVRVADHPRMRGVYSLSSDSGVSSWIIPACAGFTASVPGSGRGRPDHPRMRGVYRAAPGPGARRPGSSPHARGLRGLGGDQGAGLGIIPACAGFTVQGARDPVTPRDHPRMRGVYGGDHVGLGELGGIIPACAGFTACSVGPTMYPRDHPRMRGVYWCAGPRGPRRGGSSPHARGLLISPL